MGATRGFEELAEKLRRIASPDGVGRIARSTLGAGMSALRKEESQAAPKVIQGTVGSRFLASDGVVYSGKVGIGVGQGSRDIEKARNAERMVLGTRPRFRRTIGGKYSWIKNPSHEQLSTGQETANPFIERARSLARSRVKYRMGVAFKRAVRREFDRGGS